MDELGSAVGLRNEREHPRNVEGRFGDEAHSKNDVAAGEPGDQRQLLKLPGGGFSFIYPATAYRRDPLQRPFGLVS